MEEKPTVSVIMSVFNENLDEISYVLNSILNQTYSNIEFIIMYDNPNNTELYNALKKMVQNDERCKLLKNEINLGPAKSLNRALNNASGKYIARMDADDYSFPDRIYKQVKYMEKNRNIDLLATGCSLMGEQNEIIGEYEYPNVSQNKLKKLLYTQNFLIHSTWLVKKDVYADLNGYRDFPSSQDYDFILRFLDKNYELDVLPEKLVLYRIRERSITKSNSLKQFLMSLYIKKLHLQRRFRRKDNFSNIKIKDVYENITPEKEVKFKHAKELIDNKNSKSLLTIFSSYYILRYIAQKFIFNFKLLLIKII
ncbi:TPA: glycosyltransferase [Enterococcus faecium]